MQDGRFEEAWTMLNDRLKIFKDIHPKVALLRAQLLYIREEDSSNQALSQIKQLILDSNLENVEAMITYSELMLNRQKTEKAFFYLNHCLKFDYRNPRIWSLLGQYYSYKVDQVGSIFADERK